MNAMPAPVVMITGSRDWTDVQTIHDALKAWWIESGRHPEAALLSGACPSGADRIAERIWEEHHLPVRRFPADWATHGRAAGPIRNQQMVDARPDHVLAFPLGTSKGTRGAIRAAQRASIPTTIHEGVRP